VLGLVLGRGIDEESELFTWARAVATAVLAGVIAKIVIFAPGALAGVPLIVRLGAIACGFVAFLLIRRSIFAGVAAGEAALMLGVLLYGL
jgi:Branched-chain amino acid transport protein (AzlD)